MKSKLMCIAALFLSPTVYADSYARYGVGLSKSAKNSFSETKTLGFGYTNKMFELRQLSFLAYQYEGGFWVDSQRQEGRKDSLYGSASLGLDILADSFRVTSMHGIGLISSPDTYLGSHGQFFHDVCLGLQDDVNKANISLCYKHISNAGIVPPNIGRDFMSIKLGIHW